MFIIQQYHVQRCFLWILICFLEPISSDPRDNALFKNMETLMRSLGNSVFEFSNEVTKFNELRDSFSENGESIEDVNVEQIFTDVMSRLNGSIQGKLDAIHKLAYFAEPRAFDHYSALPSKKRKPPFPKSFFNAKLLNKPLPAKNDNDKDDDDDNNDSDLEFNCTFVNELPLSLNEHFKAKVNMNETSVHVPTSIYQCDPDVLEALDWSSDLDDTFKNNYQQNPTLGWQYFGSSTGFMRQYPATQWPNDNSDKNSPDLFDCRFRPWYTASATSPKNLLILLDVSGSMTGMRRRIAKAVVNSILDTLTENDYVNVFKFSEQTEVLVDCFNDTGKPVFVKATLENLREFRVAMEQPKMTTGMADFTIALTKAFETLNERQGVNEDSANCNQAIMLVTDGVPYYFKEFFDEMNKRKKIRLFGYLVGKEVTDKDEIQWIACYNQGFFVHIVSLGEVQEKVFKYIPVMARPLVISQRREATWTPVYANHAELVESEWQWEERTKQRQKDRSERYKWFYRNVAAINVKKGANKSAIYAFSDGRKKDENSDIFILVLHRLKMFLDFAVTNISEKSIRRMEAEKERMIRIIQDSDDGLRTRLNSTATKQYANLHKLLLERNKHLFKDFEFRKFNFLVSVSFPVFDIRNYTNTTYSQKERIANFLGVVGTDILIDELKDLSSPFQIGVNAYAFGITNNGQIVFHPDFRPLFENILKPTYNSVDLTEVELVNKDDLVRNHDDELIQMRNEMIDKVGPEPSSRKVLSIRIHRDGFKRVSIRNQLYVFGKIPRTVYTLGIQVPLNATIYKGETEVTQLWKEKGINIVRSFFDTNDADGSLKTPERNWRIHPDWTYCRYLTPNKSTVKPTKEDVFVQFIKRIQSTSPNMTWAWGSTTLGWGGKDGYHYVCNKNLVQSIVFDARITKPFGDTYEILKEAKIKSVIANFGAELLNSGILTTFISTRSGLTRWVDHPNSRLNPTDLPFTEYHPRAIEESWYQRSVERAAIEEDSYVVSVAFDAGTRNYSRVTATRAIMAKRNGKKAPVAVVGIQYDLDSFLKFFGIGSEDGDNPKNLCQNKDFHCFLLDENAFIIGSSETRDDAGLFFGEVDKYVMDALLNSSIYTEVRIMDFQAVCVHEILRTSFANVLLNCYLTYMYESGGREEASRIWFGSAVLDTNFVHVREPFRQMSLFFNWFLGYLASFLLRLNFPIILSSPFVSTQEEYDDDLTGDRNMPFLEHASINKTKLRPCDVEYKLFMYGSGYSVENRTLHRRSRIMCDETCDDYLNVQRIPYTNLIIVIVEAKCRCGMYGGYRYRKSIDGKEVEYPIYSTFVNKTKLNPVFLELCRIPQPQPPLYRKRVSQCHAYAEDEFLMKKDCGGASSKKQFVVTVLLTTFVSVSSHSVLLRLL